MIAMPDYQVGARRMAATIARQNGRDTAVKELEALLDVSLNRSL
jgi:hypothetical protein